MTEGDRGAWLRAAKMTITGMPADLLARGCQAARLRCRFPSEIIPSIMDEVASEWRARRKALAWEEAQIANVNAPRLAAPEYITADEFREAMKGLLPGGAA